MRCRAVKRITEDRRWLAARFGSALSIGRPGLPQQYSGDDRQEHVKMPSRFVWAHWDENTS